MSQCVGRYRLPVQKNQQKSVGSREEQGVGRRKHGLHRMVDNSDQLKATLKSVSRSQQEEIATSLFYRDSSAGTVHSPLTGKHRWAQAIVL